MDIKDIVTIHRFLGVIEGIAVSLPNIGEGGAE